MSVFTKETSIRNTRELMYKNEMKIISWLYKWGFSTANILKSLLGTAQIGSVRTLERNGKVTRERTFMGGFWYAFHLTELGVMAAEARLDENFEYPELTKEKVVTSHFFHDLYTQAITLVAIKKGVCIDFLTPRMTGFAAKEGLKIPDVIWLNDKNEATSVEIEVNQKWERKLDIFLGKIVENIESGEMTNGVIFTPSKATAKNYNQSLGRKTIPIWSRKSGGIWRLEREVTVRQVVRDRISIIYIPEVEMYRTISALTTTGDVEVWMAEHSMSGKSTFD